MLKILVFSQNLRLSSFRKWENVVKADDEYIIITSQHLFENERLYLTRIFKNIRFFDFADFCKDEEMQDIDITAFQSNKDDYAKCIQESKKLKNELIIQKIFGRFEDFNGYVFSDDLGILASSWIEAGFSKMRGRYYWEKKRQHFFSRLKESCRKRISYVKRYHSLRKRKNPLAEVYKAEFDGKMYLFIGKMHRIGYRLSLQFYHAADEEEKYQRGIYYDRNHCQYLTTMHERWKCHVPDSPQYDVRWLQDGYLPDNYAYSDFSYKPHNVSYYAWDTMGEKVLKKNHLPVSLIPFRKKLYMPMPIFPRQIRRVLVIASGSGDWTALKNRSDDDMLVVVFSEIARRNPKIEFVYRCHPTWIHPDILGVNSIQRVADYFSWLNLPNLHLSAHIPVSSEVGFQLSYPRSSLEEDLASADMVFGEHSISMVDASFQKIPFCVVNVTKRRNFFKSITDMGFPYATSLQEIEKIIGKIHDKNFQDEYINAVCHYNEMTDDEENNEDNNIDEDG